MKVSKEIKYIKKNKKSFKKTFLKPFFGKTYMGDIFFGKESIVVIFSHDEGNDDNYKIPIEAYKNWKNEIPFVVEYYDWI